MRIMLDTNVIISAIKSPFGSPHKAYMKAVLPPNKVVLCAQIIDEIRTVFERKFPADVPLIEKFFSTALFEIVPMPRERASAEGLIRDAKDRPILRAALAAKIDIFVTGDKDFLESEVSVPAIMSPAEFLDS